MNKILNKYDVTDLMNCSFESCNNNATHKIKTVYDEKETSNLFVCNIHQKTVSKSNDQEFEILTV